jgi:dipeptidyl aminopeptidase/acylaminoacyl peptidase
MLTVRAITTLVVLIIILIVISILLRRKVYKTIYQPLRRRKPKALQLESKLYEEIYIDTKTHHVYYSNPDIIKNKIHCWYVERYEDRPIFYYLHGNNTDLYSCRFMLHICSLLKYNLFMIDYRGFGKSSLDYITQDNLIEDVEAGYSFIQARYPANQIIVWGTSLGGNMALHIAANHPIHALMLLSTYTTIHKMFDDISLPRALVAGPLKIITSELNDQTSNMKYIKKVKTKTVFMHSKDDALVPFHHSKVLYRKMPRNLKKLLIPIKGPHDGPIFAPSQFKSLLEFIDCDITDIETVEKILNVVHAIEPVSI